MLCLQLNIYLGRLIHLKFQAITLKLSRPWEYIHFHMGGHSFSFIFTFFFTFLVRILCALRGLIILYNILFNKVILEARCGALRGFQSIRQQCSHFFVISSLHGS